jgi:hypothetical protein
MDERRQRVEQLDAFVRHRLRLYRHAQEEVQKRTADKTVRLPSTSRTCIYLWLTHLDREHRPGTATDTWASRCRFIATIFHFPPWIAVIRSSSRDDEPCA